MLYFYQGFGSQDFHVIHRNIREREWKSVLYSTCELLDKRPEHEVATLIRQLPFVPFLAINQFGDEFNIILATIEAAEYARMSTIARRDGAKLGFRAAARDFGEAGYPVRAERSGIGARQMEKRRRTRGGFLPQMGASQGEIRPLSPVLTHTTPAGEG
jgi:hypothetical protein